MRVRPVHLARMREEEEPSGGDDTERDDDQDSKRLNVRQDKYLEKVPIAKEMDSAMDSDSCPVQK